MSGLLFYLFSSILIAAAVGVVFARTTLYNVLFLIMAFFNASGLFLLAGAEFLAMILVIVYVGAVAVLFLFIVMMVDSAQTKHNPILNRSRWLMISAALIFAFEMFVVAYQWKYSPYAGDFLPFSVPKNLSNTHALGALLYTHYFYVFQIAGFILLVAMVGAIVLTLHGEERRPLRKQKVKDQLKRKKQETLIVHHVPFHKGIES